MTTTKEQAIKENEVKEALKKYARDKKHLSLQAKLPSYLCGQRHQVAKCEAKVREIESLLGDVEPPYFNILHLHYSAGYSIEKCAEFMYVSRSTAYRMLKKGIEMLCTIINCKSDVALKFENYTSADIVKVVRCKDCKYWTPMDDGISWHHEGRTDGKCEALWQFHDAERNLTTQKHYCSYGERK